MIAWTEKVRQLVTLALAEFGDLTEAELKMLVAATTGGTAYCGPSRRDDDPGNDPKNAEGWDKPREIRADRIRWLCVDQEAVKLVDPRGVRIYGARIVHTLDLAFAKVSFPLVLAHCRVADRMILRSIEIEMLVLAGSRTRGIVGDGLKVGAGLFFR